MGSESWTMTATMEKEIDGCYTRLLRHALNIHWTQHITNINLYHDIPKISSTIRQRRLRFAGHCYRATNENAHQVFFWNPPTTNRKRGRPATTFIRTIQNDTGLETDELQTAMLNRDVWRAIVGGSGKPDYM